jgi:hypothetical protein
MVEMELGTAKTNATRFNHFTTFGEQEQGADAGPKAEGP